MSSLDRIGRQTPQSRREAGIVEFDYDDRASLRAINAANGDRAFVEGIGSFKFYTGSTQVDDDETCFATSTGCWLIETIGQEYLEATLLIQPPEIVFNQLHDAEARRLIYAQSLENF